jgi:hypothetical protein
MKRKQNKERGQAIVVIAFGFIVLMAFTALAIDGGMVYSDRRHAQNAVDSGSLAGGGAAALILENEYVNFDEFDCGSTDVNTAIAAARGAAQNLMLANGYDYADFTVTTECQDTDSAYFEEKYIDIITEIYTQTRTSMIHVVYDGEVWNRVNAITRLEPPTPLAFGHAVVGLNPGSGDCASAVEGVKIGGTGDIHITGGGIWSQSCLSVIGDCSVDVDGDGGIAFGSGMHGSCGDIDPDPTHQDETLPEDSYLVPEPEPGACDGEGAVSISEISLTSAGAELDLNDEYPDATLICLTSSTTALRVNNGTLTGEYITIYLPNSGNISITGGSVDLTAPGEDPDPSPGIPGVIFYVPDENAINITGGSDSKYLGLIYAPKSDIEVTGSGDIGFTMNTQIIGYNVSLLGNATIDINFNDTWNYQPPTKLDLEE